MERKVDRIHKGKKADDWGESEVECKCVHGTCMDGSEHCKACDDGWKGRYCDVPEVSTQQMEGLSSGRGDSKADEWGGAEPHRDRSSSNNRRESHSSSQMSRNSGGSSGGMRAKRIVEEPTQGGAELSQQHH